MALSYEKIKKKTGAEPVNKAQARVTEGNTSASSSGNRKPASAGSSAARDIPTRYNLGHDSVAGSILRTDPDNYTGIDGGITGAAEAARRAGNPQVSKLEEVGAGFANTRAGSMAGAGAILANLAAEVARGNGYYQLPQEMRDKYAYNDVYDKPNGLATKLDDFAISKLAQGQMYTDKAKEGLGAVGRFGVDAANMGLDFAADLAMGPLSLATAAARAAGGSYGQALMDGADKSDAIKYGIGTGLIEGATEKIFGVSKIMQRAFGKGLGDDITEKLIGKLAKTEMGQSILRTGVSAVGEGLEEAVANALQVPLERMTIDPNAKFDSEWVADTAYQALLGATLGGVIGFGDVVGTSLRSGEVDNVENAAKTVMAAREAQPQVYPLAQESAAAAEDKSVAKPTSVAQAAPVEESANSKSSVEDYIREQTGYGEYGVKAVSDLLDAMGNDETGLDQIVHSFQNAYEAGLTNMDTAKANLQTETQRLAFDAGKRDYIMNMDSKKAAGLTIYSQKEAGLDRSTVPANVDKADADLADRMGKAYGAKIEFGACKGNAEIINGRVIVNPDYERTNQFGQEVGMTYHVAHEIFGHHVRDISPEQMTALIGEVNSYLNDNGWTVTTTSGQRMRYAYSAQGVNIDTDLAMEEVTAHNLMDLLYSADSTQVVELLNRIQNGSNAQAKQGLARIKEFFTDMIAKLKKAMHRMGSEEYALADAELKRLEGIRDAFESVLGESYARVQKIQSEMTGDKVVIEGKKNTTDDGGKRYSFGGREDIAENTSINDNPETHTPEEMAIIEEYKNAVDEELLNFYITATNGGDTSPFYLKPVSDRAASDIKRLTGREMYGYKTSIEGSIPTHIMKEHGPNGKRDHSMSNPEDVARMQYVIDNYDEMLEGERTSSFTETKTNGRTSSSPSVVYSKKINGTYYVILAVPETKAKTLKIVSAFIGSKDAMPFGVIGKNKKAQWPPDAKTAPRTTSKNVSTATSDTIIADSNEESNTNRIVAQSDAPSVAAMRGAEDGAVKSTPATRKIMSQAEGKQRFSLKTEEMSLPKMIMSLSGGDGKLATASDLSGMASNPVKGLVDGKDVDGFTGAQIRTFVMGKNGFPLAARKNVNRFMKEMGKLMKEAGVTFRFVGMQDVENANLTYSYNPDGSIASITMSAMVKNGDYPINFDLTTICKKRVAMSQVIDKLAKRGALDNGTVKLTQENLFAINEALSAAGYETACLGCFVESKRYNVMEWANTFCAKWNAEVLKRNPNAEYFDYAKGDEEITLKRAEAFDAAAIKYNDEAKARRMESALAKYRDKANKGEPLVKPATIKVKGVGEVQNTFSKAAYDRLQKCDTMDDALRERYLNIDVRDLTIDDIAILLGHGVLSGASISNEESVGALVASGAEYQKLLRPSDLMTAEGIANLKKLPNFNGVLYGHYGSGTPKMVQGFTPYNSEIALLPEKQGSGLAEYLYSIAGVRMQSFSDFQIQNVYDYLQMVGDLAARKLPAHAYSKELPFAKLFGMTGIKINLSVMFDIDAEVDSEHAGLTKYDPKVHKGEYAQIVMVDEQGEWVYNVGDITTRNAYDRAYPGMTKRFVQSIPFGKAVRLQTTDGYTANCGIIGVGFSDNHIWAMLDDGRIRYIIPYHKSGLPELIQKATKINKGKDFTSWQNITKITGITDANGAAVKWNMREATKRLGSAKAALSELNSRVENDGWKVEVQKSAGGHGGFQLYEDLEKTGDPRQTADNFIEWCAANDTMPLFYTFAGHDNYYKMLYDFNVYDTVTEEYAPQQAVQNVYPMRDAEGNIVPGNAAEEGFDSSYLQDAIRDEMGAVNEANAPMDADLEALVDNIERGEYSVRHALKGIGQGEINGKPHVFISEYSDFAKNTALKSIYWVAKRKKPYGEHDVDESISPETAARAAKILINSMVNKDYIKVLEKTFPDAVLVVPVHGRADVTNNTIPVALAFKISQETSKKVVLGIVKTSINNMSGIYEKALKEQQYVDYDFIKNYNKDEIKNKHIVVIDDTIDTGTTTKWLASFIAENGGVVDGFASLNRGKDSRNDETSEKTIYRSADNGDKGGKRNDKSLRSADGRRSGRSYTENEGDNAETVSGGESGLGKRHSLKDMHVEADRGNVGIYINSRKGTNYIDKIFAAKNPKIIETRENRKLDAFIGKRVGIIDNGYLYGYATIGEDVDVYNTYDEFRQAYKEHKVPPKDEYDFKGKTKYGYHLEDVQKLPEPVKLPKLSDLSVGNNAFFGELTARYMYEPAESEADSRSVAQETGARTRYSLKAVEAVVPTSARWVRGATAEDVRKVDSNFRKSDAVNVYVEDENPDTEARKAERVALANRSKPGKRGNGTQRANTAVTYDRVYDTLSLEGFDGTILDASSGLGVGTDHGIKRGFDVEDIEPYYGEGYRPLYSDYSRLDKQYDVVISSAVINVLPQDDADAMVAAIGNALKPGGRAYITVRSASSVDGSLSGGDAIRLSEEAHEWYVPGSDNYQRGYKADEFEAYVQDVLGNDFVVEKNPKCWNPDKGKWEKWGDTSVLVTRSEARHSLPGVYAPTFYSHMSRTIDDMKQAKIGAASVVSYLRGRGVKVEEIKWSGIEEWLEGKKSVTKEELQEFAAGSMLDIEEVTLSNDEIPFTDEEQRQIDEAEENRALYIEALEQRWQEEFGEPLRIDNYNSVRFLFDRAVSTKTETLYKATPEYKRLEEARAAVKDIIAQNDGYGFDSNRAAYAAFVKSPDEFVKMAPETRAVANEFVEARDAGNKVRANIAESSLLVDLYDIVDDIEYFSNRILDIKSKKRARQAVNMTNWQEYTLPGGDNYRELLFRLPGSEYTNTAMNVHWKDSPTEGEGVLAHARVQTMVEYEDNGLPLDGMDFDDLSPAGNMLFIEEIQSDWNNAVIKEGTSDLQELEALRSSAEYLTGKKLYEARLKKEEYAVEYNKAIEDWVAKSGTPQEAEALEALKAKMSIMNEKGVAANDIDASGWKVVPAPAESRHRKGTWLIVKADGTYLTRDNIRNGFFENLPDVERAYYYDSENEARASAANALINYYYRDVDNRIANMVPDAPFAGEAGGYLEFTLKRLLRMAAEEGYDSIGWTTAQQQSERWSEEYAEGYRIEYDQDIPKFLNKYGKKWGGKVDKTELVNGETVWRFVIPDKMKNDVLYNGQPMYSLKGISLQQENAKLRETVAALREQFKLTKEAKVDPQALRKFVKGLMNDYASGAEVGQIEAALDELFTYMANGNAEGSVTWDEVYAKALKTAEDILKYSSQVDDSMYQAYEDLRGTIRNAGIKFNKEFDKSFSGYSSYNDFRKANFGRIKFRNDGMPVDVFYADLAAEYPELFPEGILGDAAQLEQIAAVLDDLQPTAFNPFGSDMENAASWLANDIINRFFDLKQKAPTFADKAEAKLTKQKIKDAEKMDRLRERKDNKIESLNQDIKRLRELQNQKQERIRYLIKEQRERINWAIATERANKEIALAELKHKMSNAQKDRIRRDAQSRQARAIRNKITRHANELAAKLNRPSDKKHIPEELKNPVGMLLASINQESKGGKATKRSEAFAKARDGYMKLVAAGDGDLTVDPALLGDTAAGFPGAFDEVIALGDKPLMEMTVEELEKVWFVTKAMEMAVRNYGRVLSAAKYESTVEWAEALAVEAEHRRPMLGRKREGYRLDMETPLTFFSHFGDVGRDIFAMLTAGRDAQQRMVTQIAGEVEDIVKGKPVKTWETHRNTFTTVNGASITLTDAQVMEIYELAKREQAQEHLYKGGIVQPEIPAVSPKQRKIERGTDAILLTEQDVESICSILTDEQRSVADALQKLTSTTLAAFGNEASMKVYGYKKFTGTDYWPIKSAAEGIHTTIEKGANNARSIKNIGLAKSVVPHASNPLDISGVFATFARHTGDMIDYSAWLAPMEDAQRLFNFKYKDENGNQTGRTVKGLLDKVAGHGAQRYWTNLMEDIQNGLSGGNDSQFVGLMERIVGNVKGAAVGANIRVVIQQPTAYVRAAMVLNPAYMLAGMKGGVTKGNGWKKALKYAPIAQRKDMSNFDISNQRSLEQNLFGRDSTQSDLANKNDKFSDAMMWMAGKADAITWGTIWNACEYQVNSTGSYKAGSAEFYAAVSELFTNVIDATQVVDGVLQRSQLMRSQNALAKQAMSFMGEPTQALNIVLRAYDEVRGEQDAAKRSAGRKHLARAVGVFAATNVVNSLAQSIIDAIRDDDMDDDYWRRFFINWIGLDGDENTVGKKVKGVILEGNLGAGLDPLGSLPLVKDMLSILQGYDVSRMDADAIGDVITSGQGLIKSLTEDTKNTPAYQTKKLITAVGKLFGVSAVNVGRDLWSVVRQGVRATGSHAALYEMEKVRLEVGKNKAHFIDIALKAEEEGDTKGYNHIVADLAKHGVDKKQIDSRRVAKLKDDAKWSAATAESVASMQKAVMAAGANRMDSATQTKVMNAAEQYATEAAKRAPLGTRSWSEKWMQNAASARSSYGVSTEKYIALRGLHNVGSSDKTLREAWDTYGIDAETFYDIGSTVVASGAKTADEKKAILKSYGLSKNQIDFMYNHLPKK